MKCITDNIIFKWPETNEQLKWGDIHLINDLTKETAWATCIQSGPDSDIQADDQLLLSKRVTTMTFTIDNQTLHNTSDKSVIAYRHDGILKCTFKTFLYEHITQPEERTESGLYIVKSNTTKEFEPVWVKVIAAGPETGVKAGDECLIAYKSSCYSIKMTIEGIEKTLHNAGAEEIICYR